MSQANDHLDEPVPLLVERRYTAADGTVRTGENVGRYPIRPTFAPAS